MKKVILVLVSLLGARVSSQSLAPEVIAAGGDFFAGPSASISWTVGESAIETFTAGGYILTQGFQQPADLNTTKVQNEKPAFGVHAYPNPAFNVLTLHFTGRSAAGYKIELFDVTGQSVHTEFEILDKQEDVRLDLSGYENGMYLLKISNLEGGPQQLIRIQKDN